MPPTRFHADRLSMRVDPEAGGVYVGLGNTSGAVLSLSEVRILIAHLVAAYGTAIEQSFTGEQAA